MFRKIFDFNVKLYRKTSSRNTLLIPWNLEIIVVLKVRTTKENGSIFSEKMQV